MKVSVLSFLLKEQSHDSQQVRSMSLPLSTRGDEKETLKD